MVPTTAMWSIVLGALIGILFPILLFFICRRTQKLSWKAIGIGALVWFLFSQVLEKVMHLYFLQVNQTTIDLFKTPFYYALYGGLAAGVFEEVGRYIGFRFWLKGKRDYQDGLAYGIGHGGFEAIFLMVGSLVTNMIYMVLINSGTFESVLGAKVPADQLAQMKSSLVDTSPWLYLLGGFERLPAVLLHVALSLVVLYGVRTGRKVFLLYAILAHAAVDFVTVFLMQLGLNLLLIEGLLYVVGILSVLFILRWRHRFTDPPTAPHRHLSA